MCVCVGGGGHLFKAGNLLTILAIGVGAYSRLDTYLKINMVYEDLCSPQDLSALIRCCLYIFLWSRIFASAPDRALHAHSP